MPVNNSISVVGTIISDFTFSHQVFGEGFYSFSLQVKRLSEACDILPVTISERLCDKSLLTIGTVVHILGQVRSYNNFVESDRKNKLILTVFAREIFIKDSVQGENPNEVMLNGYICKPPVYRTTPFGREICDILVAVNRSYNKSDYIPCISWGRNARFAGSLTVSDNLKILGRMQSRNYQKKLENGEVLEKVALEISVSKIELNDRQYLNEEDDNAEGALDAEMENELENEMEDGLE